MPDSESTTNTHTLKSRATHGAFWALIEKTGIQAASAVVGLVMTRLLQPSDYGLIAALDLFIIVGLIISDFGMGQDYIRNQNPSREDQSIILLSNGLISTGIYLILFLCSGLIADYYGQPELSLITKVFALNIPIQALGMFQQSVLLKELRQSLLAKIKLFSFVVAASLGLTGCYQGWGVWALIAYITSFNLLNTMHLWVFAGKLPLTSFNSRVAQEVLTRSSKILSANFIDAVWTNYLTMYITKMYSTAAGGFYSKARLIQNMPVQTALQMIQSVAFPLLSKVQGDLHALQEFFAKQVKVLSFILSGILGGLILVAPLFVKLVLTEKWLPMVPYLQLLCALGWMVPFLSLHSNFLLANGMGKLNLRLEVFKKIMAISGFMLTFAISVNAIILSQIASAFIGTLVHLFFVKRIIRYSFHKQLLDLFLPAASAAVLLILFWISGSFLQNDMLLLMTQSFLYFVGYIGLSRLLGFSQTYFLLDLLKKGAAGKSKNMNRIEHRAESI